MVVIISPAVTDAKASWDNNRDRIFHRCGLRELKGHTYIQYLLFFGLPGGGGRSVSRPSHSLFENYSPVFFFFIVWYVGVQRGCESGDPWAALECQDPLSLKSGGSIGLRTGR